MSTTRALLALAIGLAALAPRAPAQSDAVLAIASSAMIVLDWTTAVDAARRNYYNPRTGQRYEEMNPIIGRNPTLGKLNTYNVGVLGANLALGLALPRKLRRALWAGVTGFELAIVLHQRNVGLRFNVRF